MVLEPRILLDASLVDTTSIEADPEQPTDLRFDVPGTRVLDPRVLDPRLSDPRLSDPRLSDPQDPQRMITPDLPTIRNWLDTANTHNARLSIVVKLWDAQPEDRISLAETYSSSSVLRDTWDGARGELRLEPRAGAASPAVAEAFLDALKAVQLEASGAKDASTREVWVFPTLSGASEVAYRVERSSGMVRHYVLDASLESYADARKTAEQQRFFGVDGYLGHFSSDAEKSVYGSMAQGRPLWLGLSDKDNAGVWKVSSGPKEGQVFWWETDAGVGIYGSGARSSGLPGSGSPDSGSPGSGWGDADWEKLWGMNDFPRRVSSGSGFPVALLDGDDAEVSSSEDSKGARIVHHDLLLSSGGFFAREVRIPDTSSASGGRSDADTGDTADVAPEKEVFVRKTRASLSRQTRQSPPPSVPPVLDVTGLTGVEVRTKQRLVLTDAHLSATDADTVLSPGVVDPAKITFRISAITGGKLQRLSSSNVWEDMELVTGEAYYAFTLADLQAGKVAFLAGDGLQVGGGERIAFKVQAVDDDGNLSDSDDATPGDQAADGSVGVDIAAVTATPGEDSRINEDGVLSPDEITLGSWITSASGYSGAALRVVVKLLNKQDGDVLSLQSGYDITKVTSQPNTSTGELFVDVQSGATAADIRKALGFLSLDTNIASGDAARRVWLFPTLSGLGHLRYRVDEAAGLMRYYLYDTADRDLNSASSAAAGRSLFGKQGYLGMYTSNAEKNVYVAYANRVRQDILLALRDRGGRWVITAGPRQGQVIWTERGRGGSYGPGAAGISGLRTQRDFWAFGHPRRSLDYASLRSSTREVISERSLRDDSITHFDLFWSDGAFFARPVTFEKLPPNPILKVDFSQATAGRPLILTEDQISADDPDTRDSSDPKKVDASKIELRITNIQGGTLHERADTGTSTPWTKIVADGSNAYLEFTLAQLQSELIAFSPDAGASTLTFDIQAADDGDGTPTSSPNLSDSDPDTDGAQPASVSIRVVALKEVEAGQKVALNDDRPRGALTPDADTLQAWFTAGAPLQIFVELQGGRSGIVVLEEGAVDESLSLSGSVPNIAATWNGQILSLLGDSSTTVADFEAALGALQLQTVRFKEDSYRTISVRPDVAGDVLQKDFYVRTVKVGASPKEPLLSVRGLRSVSSIIAELHLVLSESHILVDDADTVLADGSMDASNIMFRITDLVGGTLHERADTGISTPWTRISPLATHLEFTLAQLRGSLVSLKASAGMSSVAFKIQVVDEAGHLSDSDPNTVGAQPESISVSVVLVKEVGAGQKGDVNDDGVLTPDDDTLDAWLAARTPLRIFVVLQEGRSGVSTPSARVVQERLWADTHDVSDNKIVVSWEADRSRLVLEGSSTASRGDFQKVLGALQLQTVHFAQESMRKILVQPDVPDSVVRAAHYVRDVKVDASPPNPLLEVDFDKSRLDSGQRLVLEEEHILVYDPDTTDASQVFFRISGLTGGTLQRRSSSSASDWTDIPPSGTAPNQYLEFTLADLKAGKIAFLAGNGVAKIHGGEGEKIVFDIQAADAADSNANLSDSDPNDGESDADPVAAEILVVSTVKMTAGKTVSINADHILTPADATLGVWLQSARAHSGTLHVVVKLWDSRLGDVLSLRSGYDESKVRPRWKASTGELSLQVLRGASASDVRAALGRLQLETSRVASASTRKVWVFPTLSLFSRPEGSSFSYSSFSYRVDETAGLLRYYFYDITAQSFPEALTAASGRIIFGKKGYLGVPTSNAGKIIYTDLFPVGRVHLALTDSVEEGKWVIAAGPRKGQLFWDHTQKRYGPGAAGSVWHVRTGFSHSDFWHWTQPDSLRGNEDYAVLDHLDEIHDVDSYTLDLGSISHHDFLLSKGEILARLVEVKESPSNPILRVDFKFQATAQRPLILTEDHISVDDIDTRDPLDASKVDASKITLRVSGLQGGILQKLSSDLPPVWGDMKLVTDPVTSQEYYAFTLADLEAGKVSLVAGDGLQAGDGERITFQIQAADDGLPNSPGSPPHLSDSDLSDNDADPISVSIPVVVLKEIKAGQKVALNDDGKLTPDTDTLQAWYDSEIILQIFVELQGAKSGIAVLEEGLVAESLSLSGSVPKITATWYAGGNRLSLQGNIDSGSIARVGDFEAALGALQLQTVRFKEDSYRTISVRPNSFRDLPKKDFYVREVKVGTSSKEPILSVRGFGKRLATAELPLVLSESHMLVDDADTVLDDGSMDASRITFRVSDVVGGTLQERASTTADWARMSEASIGGVSLGYYAFTLADLQGGLVAFFPDAGASMLAFKVQAADDGDPGVSNSLPHLSDSEPSTDGAQQASVSILLAPLKEIDAGKEMPVNNDRRATGGDGALTPSDATLRAWIGAERGRLRVLVRIEGMKKGETLFLEDNHGITTITSSWSWDAGAGIGILSLNGTATVDDFQAVLNALALRTVRSSSASVRTISVRPDVPGEVEKKDYYVRDVLVRKSHAAPYIGVQKFSHLKFRPDDRAILSSSQFWVEDFDTLASVVTIVMRELSAGAELHKSDGSGGYTKITPESDASLEFTLEEFQQGLIAIYLSSPLGKKLTFELEARDSNGNWNDVGKSNTYEKGVREFELTAVLALSPEELETDLETDLETGHQKAVPFGGLEQLIETARSKSSRDGVLRIALVNAVSGDRLLMYKSVDGVRGKGDGAHRYTLAVSNGSTTSARIAEALAEIYYRASESVGEKERELVIIWVDNTGSETLLLRIPLANRPPVLRNWGIAARYHDITPARGASETPLDLGYHPFREYMPDILDNEGKVVRLEVVLVDKAGGVLSMDERVFLSQELLDRVRVEGLVLRELRSFDQKARALVIEAADGRTSVSPEFMSRILQGLSYRHGAAGRDGDVGERREISVVVFDGKAYSQTRTMEVRLVYKTPDPAKYVNTFIGTAFQKRMGVAGLSGNKAGMTFPGASYPFGMVKFSPDSEGGRRGFVRNGGYRRDVGKDDLRFGLQYLSGPGCAVAGVGQFKVGVSGRSAASDSWSTSNESSAPGYYQVGVGAGGSAVNVELATGTARTGMMRLRYDARARGGWIDFNPKGLHHKNKGFTSIRSLDDEWIVQFQSFGMGICQFGWPTAPKRGYWMGVSFHIKKDGLRNLEFSGNKLSFDFEGDNREVLGKVSMSYVRKANARENVETEVPGWDFEEQKEQGRKAWNYYLSKIAINNFNDAYHDKRKVTDRWSVFYSALYRSLLHMDVSNDVNGEYRGASSGWNDGPVRNLKTGSYYDYGSGRNFWSAETAGRYGPAQRVRFTNFSGWDVYRSQMALVGLVAPAVAGDMAQSLVHSGVEWGSGDGRDIPRWTAGEKEWGMMKGDPGPPSASSLYFFSQGNLRSLPITLDVFDYTSRERREHYSGGPRNNTDRANRVMEGMASDAAISQFAFRLSQMQGLPEELRQQAWNLYRFSIQQANKNLERLMVGTSRGYPRGYEDRDDRDGIVRKWTGDLEEGNPIQYGFMPNHDVKRLKELIDAGETAGTYMRRTDISGESTDDKWDTVVAAARGERNRDEGNSLRELQALFSDIKEYALGRWGAGERSMAMRFMMHFMDLNSGEEDTMHAFLGNEVQHAVPYLGNWFEPHLTQDVVRRALNFGFRNADWGLYGNDDLGATSSFYVWGALGIYPVIAGVGGVTLVAPSFREGEVSLPDGRSIRILANKESMRDRFVRSMTRDGRTSSNLWISTQELLRGTELVFDIGTTRSRTWGEDNADAPPSYRTAESPTPTDYRSIWLEEGDDSTGASSHSAFDGDQQSAWHFVSETDGSKVLEVDFTSVYAAEGLLLRHADVGRTSTFGDKVTVSVSVKDVYGNWNPVKVDRTDPDPDTPRMLLDFGAVEVEIRGLRLTFAGLNANEEHGIYEVLAKGGRVVERASLRSRRGLLEKSLDDGVLWMQFSPNPVLSVGGLHEQFQVTAGRVLVLGESHISVEDLDTWVPETGDVDASRITLRVRGVGGGELQRRASGSATTWTLMARDAGSPADAPVYSFSLADLRAGKIGFLAEDGSNDITFTIQAEDDDENLSDSDSVRSGDQPSSVRIPVVDLEKVIVGETSSVNSDGALTPDVATLNRWRGAAGALTIFVELHRGESTEELLLGSGHGVASIVSSWSWDAQRGIGTLSLEGSSSASASDFRSVLGFLQLRSAVGVIGQLSSDTCSSGHFRFCFQEGLSCAGGQSICERRSRSEQSAGQEG